MLHSFDVFDTVLTRVVGDPTALFTMVAQRAIERGVLGGEVITDFRLQRMQAERRARQATMAEEVTLAEIYGELCTAQQWSPDIATKLAGLEIELELQSVRPVAETVARIATLRAGGARLVFISDTYLPHDTIATMLIASGAFVPAEDRLYVSSTARMTKAHGTLFRHVLQDMAISPRDLIHTGDNLHSDIEQARKVGIQSRHFACATLDRHEIKWHTVQCSAGEYLHLSQIAGASRLARLDRKSDERDIDDALFDIGAGVAGPLLVPFVDWILRTAQARAIKHLYFVARDGQILLKIAERLLPRIGGALDLRYLHGSRQAWHLPALRAISARELAWILNWDRGVNLDGIARRIGLTGQHLREPATTALQRRVTVGEHLSQSDLRQLQAMFEDPALCADVMQRAEQARATLISYLEDVGIFSDPNIGMVDLGWHGNLQTSLCAAIRGWPQAPHITGFYWGFIHGHRYASADLDKVAFMFNHEGLADNTQEFINFANFMEIFCTADHGTTTGYAQREGVSQPILASSADDTQLHWPLAALRDGIFAFADRYRWAGREESMEAYRTAAREVVRSLRTNPSKSEAEAIGSYRFSSDQAETRHFEFGPRLNFAWAWRALYDPVMRSNVLWPEGHMVRSTLPAALLATLAYRNTSPLKFALKAKLPRTYQMLSGWSRAMER